MTSPWRPDWRPGLVACDLDGTLLGPDLVFTESTRAGVAALRAAGVPVVICTGRMFGSARPRAAELGLRSGPIVCYGGALVADLETGEWLRHEPIDGDAAAALVRFARERGLHVNAYVDDALYVEEDDGWTRWTTDYAKVDATLVGDLLPVVRRGPTKLVIAAEPDVAAAVAPEVSRRFAEALRAATSLPHFVEINAAGVTKAGHARVASRRAAPRAAGPHGGLRRRPQRRRHARVGRRGRGDGGGRRGRQAGRSGAWWRAPELGDLFLTPGRGTGRGRGLTGRARRLEEAKAAPGGRTPPSRGRGCHGGRAPTVTGPPDGTRVVVSTTTTHENDTAAREPGQGSRAAVFMKICCAAGRQSSRRPAPLRPRRFLTSA